MLRGFFVRGEIGDDQLRVDPLQNRYQFVIEDFLAAAVATHVEAELNNFLLSVLIAEIVHLDQCRDCLTLQHLFGCLRRDPDEQLSGLPCQICVLHILLEDRAHCC